MVEDDQIGIVYGRISIEAEEEICSAIGEILGKATEIINSMSQQPKEATKTTLIINVLTGALIYATWKIFPKENRKAFLVELTKQMWHNYEQYDEGKLNAN